MNANDVYANRKILEKLIDRAISATIDWTNNRAYCNSKGFPQEPDYIAGLTIKLPCLLGSVLKAVFPKDDFAVTGIFCHQKPIVNIGYSQKPELGDLLIIYRNKDRNANETYNSLLLQAKMAETIKKNMKVTEKHQLTLYKDWPEFTYYRGAGPHNGEKRNIIPKTISPGAKYLMVDSTLARHENHENKRGPIMGCAIPADYLCMDSTFTNTLINLLSFNAGRTFEKCGNVTEDWSRMIWDMMEITATSMARRKNISNCGIARQNTEKFGFSQFYDEKSEGNTLLTELTNNNKYIENNVYFGEDEDVDVGIPLIVIESTDGELAGELE